MKEQKLAKIVVMMLKRIYLTGNASTPTGNNPNRVPAYFSIFVHLGHFVLVLTFMAPQSCSFVHITHRSSLDHFESVHHRNSVQQNQKKLDKHTGFFFSQTENTKLSIKITVCFYFLNTHPTGVFLQYLHDN